MAQTRSNQSARTERFTGPRHKRYASPMDMRLNVETPATEVESTRIRRPEPMDGSRQSPRRER